jgi:peptidoglycan biosynthesis protein MviN/MurJ (putative lipid II flippase)
VAFLRLAVSTALGAAAGFGLDRFRLSALVGAPGAERLSLAAVGLAIASAIGAWFEVAVLQRRAPRSEDARHLVSWQVAAGPLSAAVMAAVAGGILWWAVRGLGPTLQAAIVLPGYAALYLGMRWRQLRAELGLR